jgi:hypothetical protein
MTKTRAKRASYKEGVAWIGWNDEGSLRDPVEIAGLISVLLLADLFGKPPEEVAVDVIRFRERVGLWDE